MQDFDPEALKTLFKPKDKSTGEDNGQVTIVGGSMLFHGAPLLALKVASRIVDIVFFATPEKSVGYVAEQVKSKLLSFIWVLWEDVDAYIKKSDAVLIGPGFMRFGSERRKEKELENGNSAGEETKKITERLLKKFPEKKWVIDAGSLQTMEADWIPANSIITPNKKEFSLLFNGDINYFDDSNQRSEIKGGLVKEMAGKYKCTIVLKGPETIVASSNQSVIVKGGNAGMTKGGTGDVLSGLTVALLAKNDPFLAACSASYIEKAAADELFKTKGIYYNSDDLANKIPEVFKGFVD